MAQQFVPASGMRCRLFKDPLLVYVDVGVWLLYFTVFVPSSWRWKKINTINHQSLSGAARGGWGESVTYIIYLKYVSTDSNAKANRLHVFALLGCT